MVIQRVFVATSNRHVCMEQKYYKNENTWVFRHLPTFHQKEKSKVTYLWNHSRIKYCTCNHDFNCPTSNRQSGERFFLVIVIVSASRECFLHMQLCSD